MVMQPGMSRAQVAHLNRQADQIMRKRMSLIGAEYLRGGVWYEREIIASIYRRGIPCATLLRIVKEAVTPKRAEDEVQRSGAA